MPEYIATKRFVLPSGQLAAEGQKVELTERQAKYLRLAGKIRPVEAKAKASSKARAEKPAAEKEK
jgi:flagellar basal body L-ring protein FlgH